MSKSRAKFCKLKPRIAFTLVELLVTIGVLGLLAALLYPAADSMFKKSRTTKCANNLRLQGIAILAYANDNGGILPVAAAGGTFVFRQVGPYLDTDKAHALSSGTDFPVFMCPERPLKVLQNRVVQLGGSITYGGYVYNPYVLGIPVNGYPERPLGWFSRLSKIWMAADGNAQAAAYLLAPATIETRIAYDHGSKADPKAQILMIDGHVEMRNVREMKANEDNLWGEPSKPH